MTRVRIATRRSRLALWQAEHVKARLEALHAGLAVELLPLSTRGDELLEVRLEKVGGKGLFVKELEQAMLEGRAELAVHSMKDVPAALPPGFTLAAILEREDARDAFVSNRYAALAELPAGARVGTSSLRRAAQLAARYPGLEPHTLRRRLSELQFLGLGRLFRYARRALYLPWNFHKFYDQFGTGEHIIRATTERQAATDQLIREQLLPLLQQLLTRQEGLRDLLWKKETALSAGQPGSASRSTSRWLASWSRSARPPRRLPSRRRSSTASCRTCRPRASFARPARP